MPAARSTLAVDSDVRSDASHKVRRVDDNQPSATSTSIPGPMQSLREAASSLSSSLQSFQLVLSSSTLDRAVQVQPSSSEWIEWEELSSFLPSPEECSKIFHCFFHEVSFDTKEWGGGLMRRSSH